MYAQLSAIALYFFFLIVIGILSRKKNITDKDFNLGSRQLNFWVTGVAAHTDDMSSWLFMAYPMAIFLGGAGKIWIAIGLILGMFSSWTFIAPRLRKFTERYDSYTLPSFYERHFGDTTGIIRVISSVMVLFFMTYYISAGLVATGRLFDTIFHINYHIGITVAMAIMISYVFIGGFVSVAWTDFAQGLFMLITLLIVPIVAFFHLESISQISAVAQIKGISLSLFQDASFLSLFSILSLTVGWGLGYFGQPHILTKFMAIKDVSEIHKSKYLGMAWQVLVLSAATAIALIGIALFPDGLVKPEMIFVEMASKLIFPFVVTLVICGILAANMSTMATQILVCATVLSEDFYKRVVQKNATSQEVLFASRLGVVLFAGLAYVMAYGQSATIMSIVEYAWSGLGGAFGPILLVALYSKSVNHYGAIAGISVGGLTAAIWPSVSPMIISVPVVALFPAFLCSLAAIYGVSWMTKGRVKPLIIWR